MEKHCILRMEKCLYLKNGTEARCGSGATVPRTRQKEEKYVIEMDYRQWGLWGEVLSECK